MEGLERSGDERSEAPRSGGASMVERRSPRPEKVPDPEVVARPKRRQFTIEYKLRIVKEADACKEPGEVGTHGGAFLTGSGARARGHQPPRSCDANLPRHKPDAARAPVVNSGGRLRT